ncbi:hypothetical protein TRAPUB_2735 [Trametes pubescens]|uniref:Uncharacterized protein n=1 Tax=Trametes pubescens TaxID=154538 RepID=A0A1M2VFU9_TRAPU|nr:hypothetical protein TRAPUB_2735 [Trametes pubescens]
MPVVHLQADLPGLGGLRAILTTAGIDQAWGPMNGGRSGKARAECGPLTHEEEAVGGDLPECCRTRRWGRNQSGKRHRPTNVWAAKGGSQRTE